MLHVMSVQHSSELNGIPYNLLALQNQNATQQLFDFQNQLRSNVAVIAKPVKERSGAPNENIVQNHINIALLNLF